MQRALLGLRGPIYVTPQSWTTCLQFVSDDELRGALGDLFVWAGEQADEPAPDGRPVVVVLVSRRMTCLYDMLVANGFDGLSSAEVISDRALDAGYQDLSGRRVLLLDDALILGTTLVDLYDAIVEPPYDASSVTARVACVDEERYSPHLAHRLELPIGNVDGPVLSDTKRLEEFALDVATSLYRASVPYYSDFPMMQRREISFDGLTSLLRSARWMVADVTLPSSFVGEGQRAYSFIPTAETAARIRRRGFAEAMALAELMKVRLYVTPIENGQERVDVRIMPIGVPGAMMVARLDDVLEAMGTYLATEGSAFDCRAWKPEAKHRALQMYLSGCVLAEFWEDLGPVLGEEGGAPHLSGAVLERGHLDGFFGRAAAEDVVQTFDLAVQAYRREAAGEPREEPPRAVPLAPKSGLARMPKVWHTILTDAELARSTFELVPTATATLDVVGRAVAPRRPQPEEVVKVDLLWAHRVLHVFGFVDKELERPQEKILRDYPYEEYVNYRTNDGDEIAGPRVLKQGLTMADLTSALVPDFDLDDPWRASLVSLAIDVGNDLGIVVPSTVCVNGGRGPVYRQYRSGETAYLAAIGHEQLAGLEPVLALEHMDRYTRSVLATKDDEEEVERFVADNDLLADVALATARIVQAWHGEVVEVTETHFRGNVESRLREGETATAQLPRDLLTPSDDEALRVGSRFDWLVFDTKDGVGRPRPSPKVRLVHESSTD